MLCKKCGKEFLEYDGTCPECGAVITEDSNKSASLDGDSTKILRNKNIIIIVLSVVLALLVIGGVCYAIYYNSPTARQKRLDEMIEVLRESTDKPITEFITGDYDGDGDYEAYALVGPEDVDVTDESDFTLEYVNEESESEETTKSSEAKNETTTKKTATTKSTTKKETTKQTTAKKEKTTTEIEIITEVVTRHGFDSYEDAVEAFNNKGSGTVMNCESVGESNIYAYSQPNDTSAKIFWLSPGERLKVVEVKDGYSRVLYQGFENSVTWVPNENLSFVSWG